MMTPGVRNVLMLLAATVVAGSVSGVPRETTKLVQGAAGPAGPGLAGPVQSGGPVPHAPGTPTGGGPNAPSSPGGGPAPAKYACAPGQNGGNTDKGVTATSINLASTIVTTGPGSTFLGLSQYGMEAVVAKVNATGGICGRQLRLKLVNDNWEAQRGHSFIKNFINENYFALPVVPSSEGLLVAGQDIASAKIPVIGSDGMLIDQYKNPWIWPVATATVSQMRIMAKYAYDQGARSFAIVHDTRYRFGKEGRDAYETYVRSLPGARFVHAEGIEPNQPGYGNQIANLNRVCGTGCDVLTLLVDPGTAEVWIQGDDKFLTRTKWRLGAQPLFNDRFGSNCGARCDGVVVFTGYVPPIDTNASKPSVRAYVNDLEAVRPGIDVTNQFLQGSYLGMTVFVEALKKTGAELTRERLRQVMDNMDYQSDLSGPLSWRADRRFANIGAQAWRINSPNSFDGFRDLRTGWLEDPGR